MKIKHFISHRGNTSGINKDKENTLEYVLKAINEGFECEIDIWFHKEDFYLGHDFPSEKVSKNFLINYSKNLWLHCKNIEAIDNLKNYKNNFFWHENDKYTLTSKKYVWTFPGQKTTENSILVSLGPELPKSPVLGVCSDYIAILKNNYLI